MTQGKMPTLPSFLKNNTRILENLLREENRQLYSFMLDEYKTMNAMLGTTECSSHLLSQDEIKLLAAAANEAFKELECITHISIDA